MQEPAQRRIIECRAGLGQFIEGGIQILAAVFAGRGKQNLVVRGAIEVFLREKVLFGPGSPPRSAGSRRRVSESRRSPRW